jgi:hypothetical protein
VANLPTMAATARSITDALEKVVEGSDPKTITCERDDKASDSVFARICVKRLIDKKLRVIILIMPPPELREIAVSWKQQALKDDRWVWITDKSILQIDFDSETPKVRPSCAFRPSFKPTMRLRSRRGVTCHRQSKQGMRSMGGCT